MANRRNYLVSIPGKGYEWNISGGGTPQERNVVACQYAYRDATDYSRVRPKAGQFIKPTSYSMVELSQTKPTGSYIYEGSGQKGMEYGRLPNHPTVESMMAEDGNRLGVSETFPAALANRVLMRARNKAKSSDVNLGQAFGERGQTAGLVAATLGQIAEMALMARRGDWKRLQRKLERLGNRDVIRDIPDAVLAFQYGIKPLVADIHGVVTALDKRDKRDWNVTIKASDKELHVRNDINKPEDSPRSWRKCQVQIEHASYVRMDLRPSNTALRTAAELGLTNPVSLAWELLPFSFVADWAWPLGDYFNQLDALLGWEVLGFSQSNRTKAKWLWDGESGKRPGLATYTADWKARRRYVRLDRNGGTVVPFATLPSVRNPLSTTHVLNALALVASAVRGPRQRPNGEIFLF